MGHDTHRIGPEVALSRTTDRLSNTRSILLKVSALTEGYETDSDAVPDNRFKGKNLAYW